MDKSGPSKYREAKIRKLAKFLQLSTFLEAPVQTNWAIIATVGTLM